jgi:uncharacterized protein (DUF1501 family)
MNVSRRVFIKNGGLAIASVGLLPAIGPAFLRRAVFAAEPTAQSRQKTLICLFQRGAADGLSVVVPHGDPNLYQLRPDLGIPRPLNGRTDSTALELDGFFGLHPALAPFLPIYQAGHLAIVHACGSPSGTRSHFDAQDFMESGAPDDKTIADGWLSRAVLSCPEDQAKLRGQESPFRTVAMSGIVPRSLQGDVGALAIPDLRTFGIADNLFGGGPPERRPVDTAAGMSDAGSAAPARPMTAASGFETLYDDAVGDVLHGTGTESFAAIRILRRVNPRTYVPANGAQYPNTGFGTSLKQIAQLVKADVGMEVAFADMGGWDTHVNQGAAQGQLAQRLREFSGAIAALYQDLGDRMADVTILTMSEFGRTARQNGNGGTDHGHATCFFVLGGDVNGGKVHGQWPGLGPGQLNEDRDLALTTDFRAVFGEAAIHHLGAEGLQRIFPGYAGSPADFPGVIRTA